MKKTALLLLSLVSAFVLNWSNVAFAKDAQKDSNTTEVKSYTRKDGTVVKGYSRTKKAPAADDTQKVASYMKKDGTVVAGYTRKKPKASK